MVGVGESERAEVLLKLDRDAEAETLIRQGLAGQPQDFRLLTQLVRSLIGQNRAKEALPVARELVAQAPESAFAHQLLAQSWLLCRKPKEGEAAAREAVRLDPGHGWNHYVLALALHDRGAMAGARRSALQAVRLEPENVDFLLLFGYLHLVDDHDVVKARKAFKRVLRIEPENSEAVLGLAQARAGQVGLDATVRQLQHALQLNPVDPEPAYEALIAPLGKMLGRQQWIAWGSMFFFARGFRGGESMHIVGRFLGGALLVAGLYLTWQFFANLPAGGWRLIRGALRRRPVLAFSTAATSAYFATGLVWALTGALWAIVLALGCYLSQIGVTLAWLLVLGVRRLWSALSQRWSALRG